MIKKGNIDGIKVLTHICKEYDIVLNINVLFDNTSKNNIIKEIIIIRLYIFFFMLNYMKKYKNIIQKG